MSTTMKNGIDVSRWQGNIDWSKVAADNVEFAIIKAGGSDKGCYTDPKFEKNYDGAKKAGIAVGAYYFVGAKCVTAEAGVADAKRFLDIIEGKQFEYPVYIDIEVTDPDNEDGATEAVIAFCETMEKAGYYVGIYASDISGFVDRLHLDKLAAYDKWVARYGSKPKKVSEYGIWQSSDSGSVAGIKGNVDLDTSYKDYPSIIKGAGLNGFSKTTVKAEKTETPAPAVKVEKEEPKKATTKVTTVKAKDPAASRDDKLAGTYTTTAALRMRHGAGLKKAIMVVLPQGTKAKNYGYYTAKDGIKWLYVQATVNGKQYEGFCSANYLKK